MDPDADLDPAIFVSDFQDVKKKIFSTFFCLLLFKGTLTSFFNDKPWCTAEPLMPFKGSKIKSTPNLLIFE